jgi:site-specific DNA recombinase
MGGMPPLGYDVNNRKLAVNDAEARIVVEIYRRYLALKSVHALRDELAGRRDQEQAPYAARRRRVWGPEAFHRIYRGEISHKGNTYPGEHPAIVEKPLWDDVQAVLAANRVERATGARARHPSLLTGMVLTRPASA